MINIGKYYKDIEIVEFNQISKKKMIVCSK